MKYNSRLLQAAGIIAFIFYCNAFLQRAYGLVESTGLGGSNSAAVHQLGETGQGVNVGLVLGYNVRSTHEAFLDDYGYSRVFNYDFSGDGISINAHDTRLAGIIGSRGGALYPDDIGVAPGANLHCARVSNNSSQLTWSWINNGLDELVTGQDCSIIVTGFELPGVPDINGNSAWSTLYDYYAYEYDKVFINAAGNQSSYITVFGDAYNGITTGGLRLIDPNDQYEYRMAGLWTGTGPTPDGRKKPDICAPSENQTTANSSSDTSWVTIGSIYGETSYAIPQAAGVAALLIGLADDTTTEPDDNHSEVIKAVIVTSTMPNVNSKTGLFTDPATNTWHPDRGYGRIDALRAYQILDSTEIEPSGTIYADNSWGFGTLLQGQTHTYTINIPQSCRFIAATTWQRRVQWTDKPPKNSVIEPDELTAYLADLDMIIYQPGNATPIFSEDLLGLYPGDNLERCDIRVTEPGNYTIVIDNDSTNGETANYGFAFMLRPIIPADLPPFDYVVDYDDISILSDEWLGSYPEIDDLLYPNGIIDFADFAVAVDSWLEIDPNYYSQ